MTPNPSPGPRSLRDALRRQKWLTLIGLPVLVFAMLNSIYSPWGLLFIYWGITSVVAGNVYLLEDVERREDPALFWIIVAMWIGTGLLYVHADIATYL